MTDGPAANFKLDLKFLPPYNFISDLKFRKAPPMPAAIETQDLTRRFGGRTAVDRISMTVPERSIYGFLGRNGAGKTTTIKLLLGLLEDDAGHARIAGIGVAADRIGAARKVGALLEAQGFYAHLTGRENLALACRLLDLPHTEVDRVLDLARRRSRARGRARRRVRARRCRSRLRPPARP